MVKVNATQAANTTNTTKIDGRKFPDDKTLKKAAEQLGISVADLKKNLKTAQVAQGKGISNLAVSINKMDMKAFCILNGIDYNNWRNYAVKSGEQFYVINDPKQYVDKDKSASTPAKTPEKPVTPEKKDSAEVIPNTTPQTTPTVSENKKKWGSDYTPAELGQKIYEFADENSKAVGRPDFDALIEQINPKNAKEVILKYNTNPDNKSESLICTITSETGSKPEARKSAVMHIYDALAKAQGTNPKVREGFEKELNAQFDSYGMVNTKKMDRTIKRMTSTPEDLANDFQSTFGEIGAVGRESFDELIKFVTPKNAAEVIKAYDKLSPKESLMNAIASEYWSDNDKCKQAMSDVFHALAEQKGLSKAEVEKFDKELNSQYDSMYVLTDKLDQMVNEALKKSKPTPNVSPEKGSNNKTKVTLSNGKVFTVAELQRGAISSGKTAAKIAFKEYCKANGIKYSEDMLDLSPINRYPEPTVSNGKIVTAESDLLKPTGKPNGKVVIINPGHGGYSSRNGFFDPGSFSFIKKGNGKYAPLLEADKMKIYADEMATKLRAEGYAVIIAGGHAQTMNDQNALSNLVNKLNKGEKGGQKYSKENISMISLHADSEPSKSGSGICYDSTYQNDTRFAKDLQTSLNSDSWITAGLSERISGKNGLLVLRQTPSIPSVLLEVEYVNGGKSKNLDSSAFREKFIDKVIGGLDNYYGL